MLMLKLCNSLVLNYFFSMRDCLRGLFGNNCLDSCSVHCKVPRECDKVTGHCFNGCQPGWGDQTCNTSTCFLLFILKYCVVNITDWMCVRFVSTVYNVLKILNLNVSYITTFQKSNQTFEFRNLIVERTNKLHRKYNFTVLFSISFGFEHMVLWFRIQDTA